MTAVSCTAGQVPHPGARPSSRLPCALNSMGKIFFPSSLVERQLLQGDRVACSDWPAATGTYFS